MRSSTKIAALTIAAFVTTTARAFVAPPSSSTSTLSLVPPPSSFASSSSSSSSLRAAAARKGFGAPPPEPKKKSSGAIDREKKASKYDEIAGGSGGTGQEYRVFVRKFGSDDRSWLPVGTVAVPRGAQVGDAIFANEDGLRKSIVRTYDRLRG